MGLGQTFATCCCLCTLLAGGLMGGLIYMGKLDVDDIKDVVEKIKDKFDGDKEWDTFVDNCQQRNGTHYGSTCYTVSNNMTWNMARDECLMKGGNLASIFSDEENEFISSLTNESLFDKVNKIVWIGLSSSIDGDSSNWVDSLGVSYDNFQDSVRSNDTCVALDGQLGSWIELPCTSNLGFVCSYPIAGPPAPPKITIANSRPGSAEVHFEKPMFDGNRPILSYTVYARNGFINFDETLFSKVDGSKRVAVIDGLTPHKKYWFVVVATNEMGDSIPSLPSPTIVIEATVPDPMDNFAVMKGSGKSMCITWDIPTEDSLNPIELFIIDISPKVGPIEYTVDQISLEDSSAFLSVTAPDDMTEYTVQIAAKNRIGTGAYRSTEVMIDSQEPGSCGHSDATVPGAPQIISATAGGTIAKIHFKPPTDNGGTVITSYRVVSNPEGKEKIHDTVSTEKDIIIFVTGLAAPSTYTFEVYAKNSVGEGQPATTTSVTTTVNPPPKPTNVSATSLPGSAKVTWSAPTIPQGDFAVKEYQVMSIPDFFWNTVLSPATEATIPNLKHRTQYEFYVVAINTQDETSEQSDASNKIIPQSTIPGKPQIASTVAGPMKITVKWDAPDDGGADIIGYNIHYFEEGFTDNGGIHKVECIQDVKCEQFTFERLNPRKDYEFQIEAINSQGSSPLSDKSPKRKPYAVVPDRPHTIVLAEHEKGIHLKFKTPFDGGADIINYEAISTPPGYNITLEETELKIKEGEVLPGYSFQVHAINKVGRSAPSVPSESTSVILSKIQNMDGNTQSERLESGIKKKTKSRDLNTYTVEVILGAFLLVALWYTCGVGMVMLNGQVGSQKLWNKSTL